MSSFGGRRARRTAGQVTTAALVAGGLLLVSSPGAQAHPVTAAFTTPGHATWTVPAGISEVSVVLSGAQGGGAQSSGLDGYGEGGKGADVSAQLRVTPGQVLSVDVGGSPTDRTGGVGGGGAGGATSLPGAGGGGASTIAVDGTIWLVAGGGGGAAAWTTAGGGSGRAATSLGRIQDGAGGGAGTGSAGGAAGAGGRTNTVDLVTCGTALQGPGGAPGAARTGGLGGARDETVPSTGGGGGGGGYFGGGGGGGGAYCVGGGYGDIGSGGGGGGGSSYVLPAVAPMSKVTEAVHGGDGAIRIAYQDTTEPVSDPVVTPAPNLVGWARSEVVVAWNWSDTGSGTDPQRCPATTRSGTWTGAVRLNAVCWDLAGNRSDASVTVQIDLGAPTASPTVSPATVSGWSAKPVEVVWGWADALSGIDPEACARLTRETREGRRELTETCSDQAGNTVTASQVVAIDRSAPTVRISRPQHTTYRQGRHVVVRFRCADAGVGVATCRGSVRNGGTLPTRKLGRHTFTVVAKDLLDHVRKVRVTYRVVR